MGASDVYGLPWPTLPDSANVPLDLEELAKATDTAIAGVAADLTDLAAHTEEGLSADEQDVQTAAGLAVALGTVEVTVAQLDGGNPYPRPRLAIVTYQGVVTGPANGEATFALYIGDAAGVESLASVRALVALASTAGRRTPVALTLPFVMAASTSYLIQATAMLSSGAGATYADVTLHRLQQAIV